MRLRTISFQSMCDRGHGPDHMTAELGAVAKQGGGRHRG